MSPALSQYLNLLRALAAIAVYLFHAKHFAKAGIPFFGEFGGSAVVAFFVLSGYLIAYAASRQPDGREFMMARLARLWSVAVPALLLTLLADTIGQAVCMACYAPMQPYNLFKWIASIGANTLFLNQAWYLNIFPGTNGPFWSLSYEFWYYVVLAAAVYNRGWIRVALVLLAAAIAGPKILVGLPVWLAGTALYWHSRNNTPQPALAWALWGGTLAAGLAMYLFDAHAWLNAMFPAVAATAEQQWSVNFWPKSYLVGALIALHIYGFMGIGAGFAPLLARLGWLIRVGADASFGLYLFHYPLMYLIRALLSRVGLTEGPVFVALIYLVPFTLSVLLALRCERLKTPVHRALRWGVARLMPRRSPAPAG